MELNIWLSTSKSQNVVLSGKDDELAGACLTAKRELDVLQVESVLLRKDLAGLQSDRSVAGEKVRVSGGDSGRSSEVERNNGRSINEQERIKAWSSECKLLGISFICFGKFSFFKYIVLSVIYHH